MAQSTTPLEWWANISTTPTTSRKATCSLALLISWEIWKEWNDLIFNHHESSIPTIMAKIMNETSIWIVAGAKGFAALLARE